MGLKYPRTPHLPCSPGGTKDDRRLDSYHRFIGKEIVITEKLDGGNCSIHNGLTYARSISDPTNHPSFDYIKNVHAPKTYGNDRYIFYGENMYAIHSIEYNNLKDYFYLFSVYDYKSMFLPWEDVEALALEFGFNTVPVLFKGTLKYPTELQLKLKQLMTKSTLGETCEGLVVRTAGAFQQTSGQFYNVAKYVRKDHVQTDLHWSKNWKKAELNA